MEPTRIVTSIVYFSMMGITLFLVFYPGEIPLRVLFVVLAIVFQFMALVWYTLSFIPFAREMLSGCMSSICFDSCKVIRFSFVDILCLNVYLSGIICRDKAGQGFNNKKKVVRRILKIDQIVSHNFHNDESVHIDHIYDRLLVIFDAYIE